MSEEQSFRVQPNVNSTRHPQLYKALTAIGPGHDRAGRLMDLAERAIEIENAFERCLTQVGAVAGRDAFIAFMLMTATQKDRKGQRFTQLMEVFRLMAGNGTPMPGVNHGNDQLSALLGHPVSAAPASEPFAMPPTQPRPAPAPAPQAQVSYSPAPPPTTVGPREPTPSHQPPSPPVPQVQAEQQQTPEGQSLGGMADLPASVRAAGRMSKQTLTGGAAPTSARSHT